MKKNLEYYAGHQALGTDPSPKGAWSGKVFTLAIDGSEWTFHPEERHPRLDGSGVSTLITLPHAAVITRLLDAQEAKEAAESDLYDA